MSANDKQVGGGHYKEVARGSQFQVWDAWWEWELDPFQANIVKYVVRKKGDSIADRLRDLDKAAHYIEKYKELLTHQKNHEDITDLVSKSVVGGVASNSLSDGPLKNPDRFGPRVPTGSITASELASN